VESFGFADGKSICLSLLLSDAPGEQLADIQKSESEPQEPHPLNSFSQGTKL
jgi:hypothetical protein